MMLGACLTTFRRKAASLSKLDEKLAAKVAASIDDDFLWPPADRTNFLALIANTKVSFSILSFELSSGYYIAVASMLFGWLVAVLSQS